MIFRSVFFQLVIYAVIAVVFLYQDLFNSTTAILFSVFVGANTIHLIRKVRLQLAQQKARYQSYVFTITDNLLVSSVADLEPLSLYFREVKEISKETPININPFIKGN